MNGWTPVDGYDLEQRPYGCCAPECVSLAECVFLDRPYCLDCADLILERLTVSREFRRLLPPLFEIRI